MPIYTYMYWRIKWNMKMKWKLDFVKGLYRDPSIQIYTHIGP